MIFKNIVLILFLQMSVFTCSFCQASTASSEIRIIENMASRYEVIIDPESVRGVKEAANEFVRLVFKSAKIRLKISNSPNKNLHQIYIGRSQYTDKVFDVGGLQYDSYFVRVINNDLYLVGRDDSRQDFFTFNTHQSASAGTYYSVIYFARKFLGANWYMPGEMGEEVLDIKVLAIPSSINVSDGPGFSMRYMDITNSKFKLREINAQKSGRLKNIYFNKKSVALSEIWGRHLRLGSNVDLNVGHSWYKWIPALKPNKYSSKAYGVSNPQFFAIPGGNRNGYYEDKTGLLGGQLCVCNDDVAIEMANNMVAYAKKNRVKSFSLSPNDGKWKCECNCCNKNKDNFKPFTPEFTSQIVNFSNKVVNHVLKEIPDAEFGLYAYSWIAKYPDNIAIDSHITISDVYNGLPYRYYIDSERKAVEENIINWRNRESNIVLTSYYTFYGHYSLPWSTPDVHNWLFGMLTKLPSSSGLRMNYMHYDVPPIGLLGADPWVLSEMLWNPEQNSENLYTAYYSGAFGDVAGPLIQQYFSLIENSMKQAIQSNKYNGVRGVKNYILDAYEPIEKKCNKLLSEAVLAVSMDKVRYQWRVSLISRAWEYTELTLAMVRADRDGNKGEAIKLMRQREKFLIDEDSLFSLARESADYQSIIVPLIN